MKLITENIGAELGVLKESVDGKTNLYIEGIFAQSEKKNRNGRIYPQAVLEREVNRYNEQMVKTKRALGELEHPTSPRINPDRVSHRITELKKDGVNWIGKALILETPCGQVARAIIEGGSVIGVSTRGMGTVTQKNGYNQINEDFVLNTVDIVTDPSGPDCFVNGIMEGVDWALNESGVFVQSERQETFQKAKTLLSERARVSKIMEFVNQIGQNNK